MKIKQLAKKYNLKRDDFWEVRSGTWVITHDAVGRIAKQEGIKFDKPEVFCELDSICMLGEARLNKRTEWTTGEASKENVAMSGKYYWAMAEKRLKDRLTLKLIDAYEFGIYSDSEADDFKKPVTKKVGDIIYKKIKGKKNGRRYEGWVPLNSNEEAPKFWTDGKSDADVKIERAIMDLKAEKEKNDKKDTNF